jgi:hypothetical protein
VEWFKSSKVQVPILPDSTDKKQEIGASRDSPKATFDTVTAVLRESARPLPYKQVSFTVHAAKNGETNETQRTSPTVTVAKARALFKSGWQVHIADSAGRRYAPSEFDEILKFDRA